MPVGNNKARSPLDIGLEGCYNARQITCVRLRAFTFERTMQNVSESEVLEGYHRRCGSGCCKGKGIDAITSREVAKELGVSMGPIFIWFDTMELLRAEVND